MNLRSNGKWKRVAFYAAIFVGLMLFFVCAHPLYIFDTDDWTYISEPRVAIPEWFSWNPTRILPEILMPFAAQVGLNCIEPLLHDYIQSLAIAFAIVLSAAIVLYLLGMDYLLQKSYKMKHERYIVLLMMLLWHFLPFCQDGTKCQHMFYADNVTCVFYYTISGLLNAGAALLILAGYRVRKENSAMLNGVLLLGVYLCINSNMYQSIILFVTVCAELFIQWICCMRREKQKVFSSVWTTIQKNKVKTGIACVWIVSILLERTGGRAQWLPDEEERGLKIALSYFMQSLAGLNEIWLTGTLAVIIVALITCMISIKRQGDSAIKKLDSIYLHQIAVCGLCLVVSIAYIVLLSAVVKPVYLMESKVKFSWAIWCFFMLVSSMAYLLKRMPRLVMVLPLLLCLVVSVTVADGNVYADYNLATGCSALTAKALDENVIRQAQEAERNGLKSVEIRVPVFEAEDWPLALSYGGERIARTLYRHGLTQTQLEIQLVMDEKINRQFGLEH